MKTKQEILDFLGLKLRTRYIITKSLKDEELEGLLFEVKYNKIRDDYYLYIETGKRQCVKISLMIASNIDFEEIEKDILLSDEKQALEQIINNPIFNYAKISYLAKTSYGLRGTLLLQYEDKTQVTLPISDVTKSFIHLREEKKYSLAALGIVQEKTKKEGE